MTKFNISIRPLYKFVVWLFFGFLIFAYGVSHPLAAASNINGTVYSSDISLSAQAQWYDTNHNSIETYSVNNNDNVSVSRYYRAVGRLTSYLSFNLYTNLQSNVLYSLTVFVNNDTGGNVQNWNNNISTGTYTGGANSNNNNGTCRAEVYSLVDSYNIKYALNMATPDHSESVSTTGAYYITFRPTCAGNYINIPVSFSNSSTNMFFYGYHLEVLGLTDGLSSSDIQNVINSSGLATASSVSDVNTSVNEVKQEINGMQSQQVETNKKLDEQNETSKGILGKIKDILSYINPFSDNFFGKKLVELIINGLKSLFIPDDNFFSNWWTDFKSFMEAKLGFLTKPIDIFITFISSYLNLSEDNIIINIPNITVPNYEDTIIIKAQTFNWKELLQSKTSLNLLWQLYLDFIDVFLIFNFIGLCEVVYARIFGGDTSAYEYYTVEDSYYFDSSTGEVANTGKHSERTVTKRKKV